MGLYIEKMELPKGGNETIIRIFPNGEILDQYGHHLGVSALSVPPHGRMIDADAFIGTIRPLCEEDKFAACTLETVKRLMVEHINNAPTIIPAEKGKT